MSKIEIVLEGVDNATGALKGVGSSLTDLADLVGGAVSQAFGNLLSDAIEGATAALGEFVAGALDSEKINAQLEAVIKSTGGAAGLTAAQVQDMASALASQTTYADDAILQGQNLLLTFTNIGKDVFPDATKAMVDMAAAMGTDVKGGAIQLGKALNDPVEGVSALSRVGVTFNDVAKDTIARMVEEGNVAGAQRIILAELSKEFGGSAAAATETLGGKIEQLKNRLGDAGEGIITALMPAAKDLFDKVIEPAIPIVESIAETFGYFAADIAQGNLPAAFYAISEGLQGLEGVVPGLKTQIEDARTKFNSFFGDLVRRGEESSETWSTVLNSMLPMFTQLVYAIQPVIDAVFELARIFADSMPAISATVNNGLEFARNLFAEFAPRIVALIADALHAIGRFWQDNGAQITETATEMVTFVRDLIAEFAPAIVANISGALATLAAFWKDHGAEVMAVVKFAFEFVAEVVGGTLLFVGSAIRIFVELATGLWSALSALLRGDWAEAWDAVQSTIQSVAGIVGDTLKTLGTAVLKLVDVDAAEFVATWKADWDMAGAIVEAAWDSIVTGAKNGAAGVLLAVNGLIAATGEKWDAFTLGLREGWAGAWEGIKSRTLSAGEAVKTSFASLFTGLGSLVTSNLDSLVRVWRANWDLAGQIARGVWDNLVSAAGSLYTDLALRFGNIVDTIRKAFSVDWIGIGESIIDGIKHGLLNAVGALLDSARTIARQVLDVIKYILGIRSPSAAFADVGRQMMAGMTLGVTSGAPQAVGATQTAALQAAQAAGNVSNNSLTFNVTQYGSPAENTARLRALAGAF